MKNKIQQTITQLYSQLETIITTLTQNINQITVEITQQEIQSITQMNQTIDNLQQEINEFSSEILYGLPKQTQPKFEIQSQISDEEINDYIRNSLEELKLMKVINQNISESYVRMQNIIQKRLQCEKYLQSYIDSTDRIKQFFKK